MLKRVLIANRGEIALSIFRACRELSIETVAIYSEADKQQPVVYLADEAFCIGPSKCEDSYLDYKSIISLAKLTDCDAIHPGYGFLSENTTFAKAVEENGLKLIGPSSKVMGLMGDKLSARQLVQSIGVPVVPGITKSIEDEGDLIKTADEIGYPVLLKASSGGGGKGMRKVYKKEELVDSYYIAKKEAKANFGDERIYVEKLIEEPRHIEFQIISDCDGNTVHLHERECSIQRKNQKLIEESPCRFLNEELLKKMGDAAVACAKACEYEGVGTVEFIVDKEENFYFIEMNTRIQVEHPVTEMVTGINLIKEQIRVASGLPIRYKQEDVTKQGHAIELRVNAQDPLNNFSPQCGKISFYMPPGGNNTRFDTYIYQGIDIQPFYDSMIGKLIVKGDNRLDAIKKLRRAVEETVIDGVKTTLGFQYAILHEMDFIQGNITTGYLEAHEEGLIKELENLPAENLEKKEN